MHVPLVSHFSRFSSALPASACVPSAAQSSRNRPTAPVEVPWTSWTGREVQATPRGQWTGGRWQREEREERWRRRRGTTTNTSRNGRGDTQCSTNRRNRSESLKAPRFKRVSHIPKTARTASLCILPLFLVFLLDFIPKPIYNLPYVI